MSAVAEPDSTHVDAPDGLLGDLGIGTDDFGEEAADGLRCNWGACCSLPAGACEAPLSAPVDCTSAGQCDDGDSCTYDSCELGKCKSSNRPDGVHCEMRASSCGVVAEGQCLDGACCSPW